MTGIVWLASYPKSGNTWLRAFLANYTSSGEDPFDINRLPSFSFADMRVEPYERISGRPASTLTGADFNHLRPQVHRRFAKAREGPVFVKTHSVLALMGNVPTITPEVTAGAIYVVRNPLDVVVSYAAHNALGIDTAIDLVCLDSFRVPAGSGQVPQFIGDWSAHVQSWRDAPGLPRVVLRYEDMVAHPATAFESVIAFLKLPRDRRKLKRAIRNSAFPVLAAQESAAGFRERPPPAERFFRRGRSGGWRDALTPDQVARLVDHHRAMMTDLGYLTPSGALLV